MEREENRTSVHCTRLVVRILRVSIMMEILAAMESRAKKNLDDSNLSLLLSGFKLKPGRRCALCRGAVCSSLKPLTRNVTASHGAPPGRAARLGKCRRNHSALLCGPFRLFTRILVYVFNRRRCGQPMIIPGWTRAWSSARLTSESRAESTTGSPESRPRIP
jgi:hypothetical protein